ncbi:hypothetical protein GX50_02762 [[Emmonsia] crescens]|uniref:AT hook domain-containing protein family protein n=1 Tax=[Emmonsia] crescens TaxID=73230 RepID=A0A2B7ZL96_9EURO|nr:hypothetical protein GX50_02762 [Emmonsia crescens]
MSNATKRNLRSSTKQRPLAVPTPNNPSTTSYSLNISPDPTPPAPKDVITIIPRANPLSKDAPNTRASVSGGHLYNALAASLIFAQHEAGSAVCIDPDGWVITCAHCFGETEEEYITSTKTRWLLFYDGRAVQVECRVWDAKRDLALLKIIAIESDGTGATSDHNNGAPFPFVPLCPRMPELNTPIICIGQPGREDLESTTGRKTDYDLVEVSRGAYRGMIPGTDPCDNSEIGTLKHDAWTYWGHSGAPLLQALGGSLVGLHSSWDDRAGMRHGVPLVAIEMFLREHGEVIGCQFVRQREFTVLVGLEEEGRERGLVQCLVARPSKVIQTPDEKGSVDVIVISSDSSDDGDEEIR